MGNIISYLKWRGDLRFQDQPFCEADNLALALLSYADLNGSVPAVGTDDAITVESAYAQYCQREHPDDFTTRSAEPLLREMAASRRFRDARLSRFQCILDTDLSTQFAALQIELEDGTFYLSYRGTDDSIVGWREDFSIGFEITPAQAMAADYLRTTLQPGKRYRVGGHSKGGNLAFYATLQCPPGWRGQIEAVYCNDSPGLCRELFSEEDLRWVEKKTVRILPGFSIIGTLFLYDAPAIIVESGAEGVLQHDAYTWRIEGDCFCRRDEREKESELYVNTFDQWINSANMEQRKTFTRDFFDALESGGAKTMPEVAHGGVDGFGIILLSIINSENRTKLVVLKFLKAFFQNLSSINFKEALLNKAAYKGIALFLLGLFCIMAPDFTLRAVGTCAGASLFLWSLRKLYCLTVTGKEDLPKRKQRFALYVFLMCLAEFYITNQRAVLVSTYLLIAALLLVFAYRKFCAAMEEKRLSFSRFGKVFASVIAMMLGVVAAVVTDGSEGIYVLSLGSFILLYGIAGIANALYQNGKKNNS